MELLAVGVHHISVPEGIKESVALHGVHLKADITMKDDALVTEILIENPK